MQEAFSIKLREEAELLSLPTLAYAINTEVSEINRRADVIGKYLMQAKEQLPDDNSFMAWVAQNFPFSHSTAVGLMAYARGISETPSLAGKPKSIVLEVIKLPASEREAFVAENDGKSVREYRKLIAEKKDAEEQAALAKRAYDQAQAQADKAFENLEKVNGKLYDTLQENKALQQRVEQLSAVEPVEVEIEVVPPDYDLLKVKAEQERRRADEAEAYAAEQEAERQRIASELRKLRETMANQPLQGNSPLSIDSFSTTIKQFITQVGMAPNMAPFFRAMGPDTLRAYGQWVDVLEEWIIGTKEAIGEGTQYVDAHESAVV